MSFLKQRGYLLSLVALGAIVAFAACGSDDKSTEKSPGGGTSAAGERIQGGTLTVQNLEFQSSDPHFSNFVQDISLERMLWRGLYTLDKDNKPQPAMADGEPTALGSRPYRLVPGVLVPPLRDRRSARIANAAAHSRCRCLVGLEPRAACDAVVAAVACLARHSCVSCCDAGRNARSARRIERRRTLFLRARPLPRGHARRSAADDAADVGASITTSVWGSPSHGHGDAG